MSSSYFQSTVDPAGDCFRAEQMEAEGRCHLHDGLGKGQKSPRESHGVGFPSSTPHLWVGDALGLHVPVTIFTAEMLSFIHHYVLDLWELPPMKVFRVTAPGRLLAVRRRRIGLQA